MKSYYILQIFSDKSFLGAVPIAIFKEKDKRLAEAELRKFSEFLDRVKLERPTVFARAGSPRMELLGTGAIFTGKEIRELGYPVRLGQVLNEALEILDL